MSKKIEEGRVNPDLGVKKLEVVPAQESLGVDNCIRVSNGEPPTVFEIVREARNKKAELLDHDGEPTGQFLVQFPGQEQELMTYAEIVKRL